MQMSGVLGRLLPLVHHHHFPSPSPSLQYLEGQGEGEDWEEKGRKVEGMMERRRERFGEKEHKTRGEKRGEEETD